MAIRQIGDTRHPSHALPVPQEIGGMVFGTQQMDRITQHAPMRAFAVVPETGKDFSDAAGSLTTLPQSGQRPPVRTACCAENPRGATPRRQRTTTATTPPSAAAAFTLRRSGNAIGFLIRSGNAHGTIPYRRRGCRMNVTEFPLDVGSIGECSTSTNGGGESPKTSPDKSRTAIPGPPSIGNGLCEATGPHGRSSPYPAP